jgi:hypothetical protein
MQPGRIFDRTITLEDVPNGYRTMASREALKVPIRNGHIRAKRRSLKAQTVVMTLLASRVDDLLRAPVGAAMFVLADRRGLDAGHLADPATASTRATTRCATSTPGPLRPLLIAPRHWTQSSRCATSPPR